ncbi:TPA: OmpA family protein [Photobacterium damselae]
MKNIHVWLLPLVGLFSMPSAIATTNTSNALDNNDITSNFYLGGRTGWSAYDKACGKNSLKCNNDTFGYGFYGGYQINRWLALEGGITSYGSPDAKYSLGKISADVLGGDISIKLGYPLTQRLELFTRIGGTYVYADKSSFVVNQSTKSHDWNILTSLGTSYRVSPHWSVRGEYQFIDGIGEGKTGKSDLHFTSLGLTYHFGSSKVIKANTEAAIEQPSQCELGTNSFSLNSASLFSIDSTEVKKTSLLTSIAERLKECRNETVRIIGYTDNTGSSRYNEMLSKLRAHSVASYLETQGIESSRLEIIGAGDNDPVASNETDEGRAKNRRVEVHF